MSAASSADEVGVTHPEMSVLATIRWWAAFVITFSVLLYAPTRLVIVSMAHSSSEPRLAAVFVLALVLNILLTWNLGASVNERFRKLTRPLVLGLWSIVVTAGVYLQSAQPANRLVIALLFAAGLVCVPWLAWIGFDHRPRGRRMAEGLAAAIGSLVLVSMVTVEAMQGDNTLDFTWTWSPPRDMTRTYPEPTAPADITAGFEPTPDDFPQFLGPGRSAVIESRPRRTDWSQNPPRELWRKQVGPGWSSFAVRGDYAFTQEQRGEEEAVTCYRVPDGELMWMTKSPGRFSSSMGGIGPRATPTIHADGRLYTVGATGTLQCLDACSGSVHWSKNIVTDNGGSDHNHGICGSPLIVDDLVVVAPTGTATSSLVAYDRLTGERRWQAGQSMASYASPALLKLVGTEQVLLHTQQVLESHDPATGKLLWEFPWSNVNVNNCSQPIVIDAGKGRLVVTTGYGTGAALIEVAPADPTWNVATAWTSRDMKTKFTTAVRVGDDLYGLDDGILGCISLADGRRKWKTGRYKHGQILLVGSTLLVQAEMGELALVDPRPEKFVELAQIPMLKGTSWNNPAVAGKYVLVRNSDEAVCLEWPVE